MPAAAAQLHVRRLNTAMRALAVSLSLALCAAAHSTPVSPVVRVEIDTLLARLQSSGCEFNRNGSWYSAADAKVHLLRKLEYLERNASLSTTEQFIKLAGTSSSSSGQAYQVRCGTVATSSAAWLTKELATVRANGQAASAPR